jgi:hypothetical protein
VNKFISKLLKKNQFKCGACGGEDHKLFKHPDREAVIVACCQCDSASELCIPEPSIKTDWIDGSPGIICTGWSEP